MSCKYCSLCNKELEDTNWRYRKWDGEHDSWACSKHFVPKPLNLSRARLNEQRKAHKDDLTQPYLPDGSFNGRFRDLYPEQTKNYIKEGNVTKEQVSKAKVHKDF